ARTDSTLAIGALHFRNDVGQLFALLCVGGGRESERNLEQLHFSRKIFRQLEPIEPASILSELDLRRNGLFVPFGSKNLGVIGNVRGPDPVRTARINTKRQKLRLCLLEKRPGSIYGRFGHSGCTQTEGQTR